MWSVPTHLPRPPRPSAVFCPFGEAPLAVHWAQRCCGSVQAPERHPYGSPPATPSGWPGLQGVQKASSLHPGSAAQGQGPGGRGGVSNHTVSRGGCFRVRHHLWVAGPWLSAPACQEPPIPPPVASPLLSLRAPLHPPATRIACRPTPPSHVGTTASTRQCAPGSWLR